MEEAGTLTECSASAVDEVLAVRGQFLPVVAGSRRVDRGRATAGVAVSAWSTAADGEKCLDNAGSG